MAVGKTARYNNTGNASGCATINGAENASTPINGIADTSCIAEIVPRKLSGARCPRGAMRRLPIKVYMA